MAYGDYRVTITEAGGLANFVQENTSDSNRLIEAPELEQRRNYPKIVRLRVDNSTTTGAQNWLSSSFAGWSGGTRAVTIGDSLKLEYWATGDSQLREIFNGVIVTLDQDTGGILNVTAKDWLELFENTSASKIIHSSYRDRLVREGTSAEEYKSFTIPDATSVRPFATVEYSLECNEVVTNGDNNVAVIWDDSDEGNEKREVAWRVRASGPLVCGKFGLRSESRTGNVRCSAQIYADGDGQPGDVLYYSDMLGEFEVTHNEIRYYGVNFCSSSVPFYMAEGRYYWIGFACQQGVANDDIYINLKNNSTTAQPKLSKTRTWQGAWGNLSDTLQMDCTLCMAEYNTYTPDDYTFNSGTSTVYIKEASPEVANSMAIAWYRGRISYYYGTVTHRTICQSLIRHNFSNVVSSTSASQTETWGLYNTAGKTLAECLREVCNTYGWGNTNKTVVASYMDSGAKYVCTRKRHLTSEDSVKTFSHGADTSTDDEVRIIKINMKQTTQRFPSITTAVGESGGQPVVVTTHTLAKSAAALALRGLSPSETLRDKGMASLSNALNAASSSIERNTIGIWEGSITVSGCFPDLFEIEPANDFYGAGKIITLNYSPLGITSTKFEVVGITVNGHTTEIRLSNDDILDNNKFGRRLRYSEISSGFYSPISDGGTKYVYLFDNVAVDGATAYMWLLKDSNTIVDSSFTPVLCTKLTDTPNNLNIYHAEFDLGYGVTASGAPITHIKITSDYAGANQLAKYALYDTSEVTMERQIYKWRPERLVVDYTCKKA